MDTFKYSLRYYKIRLFVIVALQCSLPAHAQSETVNAMRADQARYVQLERIIKKNRHVSAHLVLAVDARTIKEVRKQMSVADIPILMQMLGDKNYGVASAASEKPASAELATPPTPVATTKKTPAPTGTGTKKKTPGPTGTTPKKTGPTRTGPIPIKR